MDLETFALSDLKLRSGGRFEENWSSTVVDAAHASGPRPSCAQGMTMPSQDADALAELARLCGEVRSSLPDSGFHRLRVLIDMILVDLAREGFAAGREARSIQAVDADSSPPTLKAT